MGVVGEFGAAIGLVTMAAHGFQSRQQVVHDSCFDTFNPPLFRGLFLQGNTTHVLNALKQLRPYRTCWPYATEVGEVEPLGLQLQKPLHASLQCLGIELHWRGSSEDERPLFSIQVWVAQAKGITREDAPTAFVIDAEVVPGMPPGIQE